MPVKVITDSSAGIPPPLVDELDIGVVPIWLHLGEESYRDGIELELDDFYQRLEGGETPTTSSPSPGEFAQELKKAAADEYQSVLIITPSADFSGSFNAAMAARNEVEDLEVGILDSRTAISAQALVTIEAARAAYSGSDLEAVRNRGVEISEKVQLIATIDTLRYLRRSGRVNVAQFMLGETLRVKPMFRLHGGEVSAISPALSERSALTRILEDVEGSLGTLHAGVFHGNVGDRAEFLRARIVEARPDAEVFVTRFSPAMGSHTGPGVVGVAFWSS